jgi:hypothetical protein
MRRQQRVADQSALGGVPKNSSDIGAEAGDCKLKKDVKAGGGGSVVGWNRRSSLCVRMGCVVCAVLMNRDRVRGWGEEG